MTWWESWFGEEYLELYPHRDLESARREVAFALARLDTDPTPLLDLACGSGRHSLRFAEKGIRPVGLDYSAPLLELARARNQSLRLVRGDMRSLPFADGAFRSVVNFFTSFGYFVKERDNAAVVEEIERVLASGGRFLCDTFGLDYTLARLVREESRSSGDRDYRIRRWWNGETRRVEKEIEVKRGGSTEIFRESVRAYTAEELTGMFRAAGLVVEAAWGDFAGSPVGRDSPRLILLARKPQ
ncbi:MAG TPA: class I SAM-dependent methyltransferase [Thermoanaerobaculia bacterium]|nr:class I SAM-dependent methyltransferase [Thermoanaerobaculia bacterium]